MAVVILHVYKTWNVGFCNKVALGLNKTTKIQRQCSRCLGRVSNGAPPKYKSGALPVEPVWSVNVRCELYCDTAPPDVSVGRRVSERETRRREKAQKRHQNPWSLKNGGMLCCGEGFCVEATLSCKAESWDNIRCDITEPRFVNAKISVDAIT